MILKDYLTYRQRDPQTERHTGRKTYRPKEKQTSGQMYIIIWSSWDKYGSKDKRRRTFRQIYIQTNRHIDELMYKNTYMIRQRDNWAEGQIYGNKLINTNGYFNHIYIYLILTRTTSYLDLLWDEFMKESLREKSLWK